MFQTLGLTRYLHTSISGVSILLYFFSERVINMLPLGWRVFRVVCLILSPLWDNIFRYVHIIFSAALPPLEARVFFGSIFLCGAVCSLRKHCGACTLSRKSSSSSHTRATKSGTSLQPSRVCASRKRWLVVRWRNIIR